MTEWVGSAWLGLLCKIEAVDEVACTPHRPVEMENAAMSTRNFRGMMLTLLIESDQLTTMVATGE
jgi:hypothetical protein